MLIPELLTAQVVTEQSHVGEVSIDALAVHDGCLGRVRIARVPQLRRHSAMRFAFPNDLASLEVEAIDHPAMYVGLLQVATGIAADCRLRQRLFADGGC